VASESLKGEERPSEDTEGPGCMDVRDTPTLMCWIPPMFIQACACSAFSATAAL
jgi:hypothetical protein